jgi:hypothetical protein
MTENPTTFDTEGSGIVNILGEALKEMNTPPTPPADPPAPPTPPTNEPPTPPTEPPVPPVEPPTPPPTDPPADGKNLLNLLNAPKDPAAPVDPPKELELPEEIKAQLEKAKQFDELQAQINSNPLYKAFALGADMNKLKEIVYDMIPQDLSQLDYKSLVKHEIESKYGSKLQGELLNEALEEKMAEYEGASAFGKIQMEETLREKYKPTTPLKESEILKAWEAEVTKAQQNVPPAPTEADIQAIVQADIQAIDSVTKGYVGGDIYGFKFDENVANAIKSEYNDLAIQPYLSQDEAGRINFNEKQFVNDKLWAKYGSQIINNAVEYGKKLALKDVANPDLSSSGAAPQNIQDGKTPDQKIGEHLMSMFNGR